MVCSDPVQVYCHDLHSACQHVHCPVHNQFGLWSKRCGNDCGYVFIEKLQADRESADTWKDVMDKTKEGTDEWNEAVSNWTSASSQLFTDFQDAIKNAADAFSNKIKLNFQNFYAGISNGGQIGDFEREKYNWEAAVKRDEEYLDTVTKSYEIDKLRSRINTEINKTSSSSSKQK